MDDAVSGKHASGRFDPSFGNRNLRDETSSVKRMNLQDHLTERYDSVQSIACILRNGLSSDVRGMAASIIVAAAGTAIHAKYQKALKRKRDTETVEKDNVAPKIPKGSLILKTYDPESGVVLKFKTDKAADVGRLIGGLGRLGRHMAALPEGAEDAIMEDAATTEPSAAFPSKNALAAPTTDSKPSQISTGAGGGGGKKKKKGKK